MFTFAFDAGGDESQPVLTVAGFVSSERDWDLFSEEWEQRLKQDGIEYFRAVGGAQRLKQVGGGDNQEGRRKKIASDLMTILKTYAYRQFGCTVINREFNGIDENLRSEFRLGAYSLAGRTCARFVREWVFRERIRNYEMLFEMGDKGQGDLQHRLVQDMGWVPRFRPKKDTTSENGTINRRFAPLQAGDWLAYELSRLVKSVDQGPVSFEELRWPMKQFYSISGVPYFYTIENTHQLEKLIKSSKELAEWTANLRNVLQGPDP